MNQFDRLRIIEAIFFTMLTLVSGTNRWNSQTEVIARFAAASMGELLREKPGFINLAEIKEPYLIGTSYAPEDQSPEIRFIQDTWITPAKGFYFVIPEYNGSFPGILKYFLDACSLRDYHQAFGGKKAAILGLSTGKAGNLRGMDHLTGILHYLNVTVMPNRLPISRISGLVEGQSLADEESQGLIHSHVQEFIQFCCK